MGFQIENKRIKFEDYRDLQDYESSYPVVSEIIEFLDLWFGCCEEFSFYTSGSTGEAKEITHSKFSMLQSADFTQAFFNYKNGDTSILSLPMRYVSGKMMLVRALRSDLNLIIQNPSSNPLSDSGQQIDFLALTPMQLLVTYSESLLRLKNVNTILLGGSTVDSDLIRKFRDWDNRIYIGFGMTETLTHIALRRLNGDESSDHYTAVSLDINFEVNHNQCLVIDAPHLKEKIVTNDIVDLINNHQFYWQGRRDNLVNSGGIKLNVEEIEKSLSRHLNQKFFLFGESHKLLGQCLSICIEGPNHNILLEKIQVAISRINRYHQPRKIYFLDRFEYTENGKLMRKNTIEKLKHKKSIVLKD